MIAAFRGLSADEAWLQAVDEFRRQGEGVEQASRNGPTKEILHTVFSIEDPLQKWVFSRTPPINIAFALAEVVWMMTGRRDQEFLLFWNSKLLEFVGNDPDLHGAYGYRLRHHWGFDQLKQAFRALEENLDSRQVVLQIWDGTVDLPMEDGQPRNSDIPCNTSSLLKVRAGKLEWMQILRSNDMFRGLPYNFVQFTSIQEIMAGWLNIGCGSYNHLSDSLHVYKKDWDNVMASNATHDIPPNTDSLALPFWESEQALREVANRIELMISDSAIPSSVAELSQAADLPEAYQNILTVLTAEFLRRRREPILAESAIESCTNPAYVWLWSQWRDSLNGSKRLAND